MNDFWIKIKPSEHALDQAKARNLSIPTKINLAAADVLMVRDTDNSMIIFEPMYYGPRKFRYYKKIPVAPIGHNGKEVEVEAISIMLREPNRVGKAKPFSTDFLFDLRKLGLL